jgi:hypothetical protein
MPTAEQMMHMAMSAGFFLVNVLLNVLSGMVAEIIARARLIFL